MTLERTQHLRALADYLGKEVYTLDYDEQAGCYRQLPGLGAGTAPVGRFHVHAPGEGCSSGGGSAVEWKYLGVDYRIERLPS